MVDLSVEIDRKFFCVALAPEADIEPHRAKSGEVDLVKVAPVTDSAHRRPEVGSPAWGGVLIGLPTTLEMVLVAEADGEDAVEVELCGDLIVQIPAGTEDG